jgi:4a-hydroxytetrahydrobiopterin dehydratase
MNTRMKKLTSADVTKKLKKAPLWSVNTKKTELSRSFSFSNFVNGLAFTAKLAVHAEVMGHHPDIELSYGKVKVRLGTHDVKGLTNADFELAQKIDGLKLP